MKKINWFRSALLCGLFLILPVCWVKMQEAQTLKDCLLVAWAMIVFIIGGVALAEAYDKATAPKNDDKPPRNTRRWLE